MFSTAAPAKKQSELKLNDRAPRRQRVKGSRLDRDGGSGHLCVNHADHARGSQALGGSSHSADWPVPSPTVIQGNALLIRFN